MKERSRERREGGSERRNGLAFFFFPWLAKETMRAERSGHRAPASLPLLLFYWGGPFTEALAATAMSSSPGRKTGEEVEGGRRRGKRVRLTEGGKK